MLARFFIDRPVLANVIALLIVLLGGVALFELPVAQYPPITPPTVQVTATYPGADSRTLLETVALPIEQQVNGVEKMIYMQSTCTADGRYTLIVTFEVGTDLDFAQVLVQNRVAAAMAQLPQAVQQQGVVTKKKSTAILQIITLTSSDPKQDALFLSNYATINLRDRLARLPGAGDVLIFGIGEYGMRVWLDPELMVARSLTPRDVINAIQKQNAKVAAGQLGMPPAPPGQQFQYTVTVESALQNEAEFEQIIVKTDSDGQITRIADIGRVELGARTYGQFFKMDGAPAGGIAIYQLPEANALDTAQGVREAMEQYAREFPQGMRYQIPFDTTLFVQESVTEVYHTLYEAGFLVLIVILLFLQNFRATLVPATTVPVTIVGAFAGMALLGFTVNLLTLFAVVLAIGIVVDDAIVVVEGAAKHIEGGKTPRQASIDAMGELLGPIVGITLVLMSVFLQADSDRRLTVEDVKRYWVRGQNGQMVPLGAVADISPTLGPSLISLYNLFPAATITGATAQGYSSGQGLSAMRGIADKTLGAGLQYQWTAMSYQEEQVGSSAYFIFALAIVLVYLVLAGQYGSWITPGGVILAVPLALLGTVAVLLALGVANNIYVQIGLVLLIALSAKNGILIVEMAREGRAAGRSIEDAAVEAAHVRFRPILMTSFVFILGVMPLVLASGAGASARKSLGIAVASGMLASTCLAVVLVPSFYVVLQKFAERKKSVAGGTKVRAGGGCPTPSLSVLILLLILIFILISPLLPRVAQDKARGKARVRNGASSLLLL